MIRREGLSSVDEGEWILISQIDHAHLAGKLAEHWGAADIVLPVPHAELWAIHHHDDGWREWEQTPDIEPRAGRPRQFTEMPVEDSLAIWTASIEIACQADNLAGFVVAGHFCALARRSPAWRNGTAQGAKVARFITHFEDQAAIWQQAWHGENPATNTVEIARRALARLQFFDSLSLWFCCAPASEPERIESPDGPPLTLASVDPRRVQLSPWPLAVPNLNLEIPARAVAVRRYRDSADLARAPSRKVQLDWQLVAGEPNP
jgi:hypothetical protein